MQAKGLVKFFLILLTIVSVVQYLFLLPTNRIEKEALRFAEDLSQNIEDPQERNQVARDANSRYLDSLSKEVVLSVPLLKKFTYEELKKRQLGLGLDLKGGISTVLQVDLYELILSLSNNSKDPIFLQALDNASKSINAVQVDFVTLFGQEFEKIAEGRSLASIFSRNQSLKDDINLSTPNAQVLSVLRQKANETVDRTFKRMKDRIDKFGVVQPNVSLDAARDLILVELPGVDNAERARSFLQATADLEFWNVYRVSDNGILSSFLEADERLRIGNGKDEMLPSVDSLWVMNYDSLGNIVDSTLQLVEKGGDPFSNAGPLLSNLNLNMQTAAGITYPLSVMGTAERNKKDLVLDYLNRPEIKRLFPQDIIFLWSSSPMVDFQTKEKTNLYELYAIRKDRGRTEAPLTGENIIDAFAQQDPYSKEVGVSLRMNTTGARIWGDMTTRAAQDNNREIAIVLDNEVVSCPRVNTPITDGNSQITGNFSLQEATDLANILQIGKLPAKTVIIQESLIGPSLGQDNINKSLISLLVGFGLVLLFMILYYATGGIVSIIALFANLFFIFGALSSFGTVLTLPGIAGIVLTIGMAVDANVIIFERIREEIRAGKTLLTSIADGFRHSYSAIIDANVTTLLTAFVLSYFGIGPIKGFAVVLIIGVITSLITAVLLTRLLVDWWTIDKEKNMDFSNSISQNSFSNLSVDWISKRKMSYIFSSIIIILGFVSFAIRGFELGVDFKGGRSYNIEFFQDIDPQNLRTELGVSLESTPVVKSISGTRAYNVTTSYLISETGDEIDDRVMEKLFEGVSKVAEGGLVLEQFKNPEAIGSTKITSSSKVGPTIAEDIKSSSFKSTVVALLLIFFYIFIRFSKWQYSTGAIVAIFHDVLVVLSLFSIGHGWMPFSLEVDQAFIAALLTVIGYSINDTVVVFDRIREYYNSYAARSRRDLINSAINNTLNRTIITSVTTLLVVTMLLLFGGASIKGFAFALVIGVLVGTYSSIFIASPIMYDLSGEFSEKQIEERAEALESLENKKS
jgi:SecD/SecF fusion protein